MATKILTTALLCAALAACGGGGSDVPTSTSEPTAGACKAVRVQLFGDSTMVNLDAFTKDANGVPALQRAMDARSARAP